MGCGFVCPKASCNSQRLHLLSIFETELQPRKVLYFFLFGSELQLRKGPSVVKVLQLNGISNVCIQLYY